MLHRDPTFAYVIIFTDRNVAVPLSRDYRFTAKPAPQFRISNFEIRTGEGVVAVECFTVGPIASLLPT
jgi:hypothetical protein